MIRTSFLFALLAACNGDDDTTKPTGDTGDTVDTVDTTPPVGDSDLVDLALADPQFSTLAQAIVDAGLESTLRGDGPFTVFAPTNDAFDALGVDLSTLSTDDLATILTYHVVAGEVPSTAIPATAPSVAGFTLFFDTSAGVMVNNATVTTADVQASNGILHVVDQVLLPPTILDAVGYAGLEELGGAVGAADPAVATLLGGPGSYTVFAPTDDAFAAIASVTAGLTTAELTDVLTYHVYAGEVRSDAVPAKADSLLVNEWGYGVTALFDTSAGVVVNGGADVVIADIVTTNGVIHVVDEVLLPPTVVDLAVNAGLDELVNAVGAADGDLGTVLAGPGPFTVFAPTDDAFAAIASVAATLTPEQLRDVLLYHVVGAYAVSTGLSDGPVPTLLGPDVQIAVGAGVTVNGANVVVADVHGTNGVVHVIDAVLIPAM